MALHDQGDWNGAPRVREFDAALSLTAMAATGL
jgi:hypothetical protein